MKEGDVILTSLSQADGKVKMRPAIILREMPGVYRDVLLCGVSAQLHLMVEDFDELIELKDEDFQFSGLLKSSLIRLGYIGVQPRSSIAGVIGAISHDWHVRLLRKLSEYLLKQQQ